MPDATGVSGRVDGLVDIARSADEVLMDNLCLICNAPLSFYVLCDTCVNTYTMGVKTCRARLMNFDRT